MQGAGVLLILLSLCVSAVLPAGGTPQQVLQSTALGARASAVSGADFCAGADEGLEPHGWARFPRAPGIPGHLLDAALLQALAEAAQHTAWQPCSRGEMTVWLEGCQQVRRSVGSALLALRAGAQVVR